MSHRTAARIRLTCTAGLVAAAALLGSTSAHAALAMTPAQDTGASAGSAGHGLISGGPSSSRLGARAGGLPLGPGHDGLRTAVAGARVGRAVSTAKSGNWAGLVTKAASGTYQGVYASWRQPAVSASADNRYSCTWVGIDGATKSDPALVQTGTEADWVKGHPVYYAWYEMLPDYQVRLTYSNGSPVPVRPGDAMSANVYKSANPGTWTMVLSDTTQHWKFSAPFTYTAPGASAEWVEEATEIGKTIASPARFGSVTFSNLEVAEAGKWYYTALTASNRSDIYRNGWKTSTSVPAGSSPQRFTTYSLN